MFAPIHAPTIIQTVHGLTYKVVRVTKRDEKEDPQHSNKSNRFSNSPKRSSGSGAQSSDSNRTP
ncbi:hypothetical protein SAMN06265222_101263 [Neorhodopirellula lusitana]|uniref:Uncharacterized protein n=1 Tax=Neorhodopirellula lusitana TaxID=445327 RepID=A0ABY1PNE4_9BACT|nr:hypothetical protein [Neorhodopirellula lusitana]SMP39168.1 hypothetical protein SAMN06265222_101263 [Neorhodopirellula lusitana]